MSLRPFLAIPLITLALIVPLTGAQPAAPSSPREMAMQEIARQAAADFMGSPGAARYRRLAVVPRGGDASEAAADALGNELTSAGCTVAPPATVRSACERAGVAWATSVPIGARGQALIMEGTQAQGLILVQASTEAVADGSVEALAQMALADPGQLGTAWSIGLTATASPLRRTAGRSYWQEHPMIIGGLIGALVLLWALSALLRRRAA
jgi:hypothetical protein